MINLFGVVFHLDTSDAHLRIEYPAVTWEADLGIIEGSYKLRAGTGTIPRWLYSLASGVFALEFPEPVQLQGDFVVKVKSYSGTKTLYRGFTCMGYR